VVIRLTLNQCRAALDAGASSTPVAGGGLVAPGECSVIRSDGVMDGRECSLPDPELGRRVGERHDLQGHSWHRRHLHEVVQLGTHYLNPAHRSAQDRLVHDLPNLG
jgi:hypothetical protein